MDFRLEKEYFILKMKLNNLKDEEIPILIKRCDYFDIEFVIYCLNYLENSQINGKNDFILNIFCIFFVY